jgi:hypothetical protein
MTKKYEVLTYTVCQGWINCWTTTEDGIEFPTIFDTEEEAQAEIDELLSDIQLQIVAGERQEDEGYDPEEFRIREFTI